MNAHFEIWAEDEHRMGTKPIVRKVWAKRGKRPVVVLCRGYKWLYVYGFVHPESGKTELFLIPTVSADAFSAALAEFARATGATEKNRKIIVLDQAGWHKSAKVEIPEGIHLLYQPSNSPELQPAEHLWPLIDEVIVNSRIKTIHEIDQRVGQRCCDLASMNQAISKTTFFYWWPRSSPIHSLSS